MSGVLFAVLFTAAAVAFLVINYVLSKRDERAWRNWLAAREWSFIESWPGMKETFTGGPFGRGHGRRVTIGFQGRFDSLPVSGFRYTYKIGSGDDETTHDYQVLLVRIPGARFPFLTLGRENILTRAFVRDTQFEDAEFNRLWAVHGSNARFTHDVVHPRMMEFLKGLDIPEMENLWLEGDSVLVSVRGTLAPSAVDGYLRLLTRLVSQIPPFVLNQVAKGRLALTWDGPGVSAAEQQRRIAEYRDGR